MHVSLLQSAYPSREENHQTRTSNRSHSQAFIQHCWSLCTSSAHTGQHSWGRMPFNLSLRSRLLFVCASDFPRVRLKSRYGRLCQRKYYAMEPQRRRHSPAWLRCMCRWVSSSLGTTKEEKTWGAGGGVKGVFCKTKTGYHLVPERQPPLTQRSSLEKLPASREQTIWPSSRSWRPAQ